MIRSKTSVSVIIPCYNQARFLSETVETVFAQGDVVNEIVIVNDGSTDDTQAVADHLASRDPRVRVIHQSNSGLSASRNKGLDVAAGAWIQFLDSDDLLYPGKIERQIGLANAYGFDVVTCDYERINEMSEPDYMKRLPYLTPFADHPLDLYSIIADWETRLSVPAHCFLIRRSLIESSRLRFDSSLPTHEDWHMWTRLFLCGAQVGELREVLCAYRHHPSSMSRNHASMRDGYLMAIDDIRRCCVDTPALVALLDLKRHEVIRIYDAVTSQQPKWNARFHRLVNKLIRF